MIASSLFLHLNTSLVVLLTCFSSLSNLKIHLCFSFSFQMKWPHIISVPLWIRYRIHSLIRALYPRNSPSAVQLFSGSNRAAGSVHTCLRQCLHIHEMYHGILDYQKISSVGEEATTYHMVEVQRPGFSFSLLSHLFSLLHCIAKMPKILKNKNELFIIELMSSSADQMRRARKDLKTPFS